MLCHTPKAQPDGIHLVADFQCSKCHTVSCYICRKVITNGYAHFDQSEQLKLCMLKCDTDFLGPVDQYVAKDSTKCILRDQTGKIDAANVSSSSPMRRRPLT
jgi:hypothetical protein